MPIEEEEEEESLNISVGWPNFPAPFGCHLKRGEQNNIQAYFPTSSVHSRHARFPTAEVKSASVIWEVGFRL